MLLLALARIAQVDYLTDGPLAWLLAPLPSLLPHRYYLPGYSGAPPPQVWRFLLGFNLFLPLPLFPRRLYVLGSSSMCMCLGSCYLLACCLSDLARHCPALPARPFKVLSVG